MPITVYCKQCGKKMNAPDSTAGKRGKCKDCGGVFDVPHESETGSPFVNVVVADEHSAPVQSAAYSVPRGPLQRPVPGRSVAQRRTLSCGNQNSQGVHIVAMLCAVFLLVGCFLPWIQLGALIQNRGLDNPDGAIVLVAAICCGAAALFHIMGKQNRFRVVYLIAALVCGVTAAIDLKDVNERAQSAAENFNQLGALFGQDHRVDMWQFVGSGLYIILIASVVLLVISFIALSRPQAAPLAERHIQEQQTGTTLCIECGKYFEGEPRFCPNCGQATKFG